MGGLGAQRLFSPGSLRPEDGLQHTHRGREHVLAGPVALAGQPPVPGLPPVRRLRHNAPVGRHCCPLRVRVSTGGYLPRTRAAQAVPRWDGFGWSAAGPESGQTSQIATGDVHGQGSSCLAVGPLLSAGTPGTCRSYRKGGGGRMCSGRREPPVRGPRASLQGPRHCWGQRVSPERALSREVSRELDHGK